MRLIDADALNYEMLYKENWIAGTGVEAPAVWKKDIESAPTIYPEQKRGKWGEKYIEDAEPFLRRRFYCSACGEWQTYGETNYCPNCGAKMDMKGE